MSRAYIRVGADARVFILEDDEARMRWFNDRIHDEAELVHASNAEEAIRILAARRVPFDIMFLDHDLSYVDQSLTEIPSHDNTGSRVAHSIAENNWLAETVVIHSWNPAGAANMAAVLGPSVVVIPFGSFEIV